MFGFFKKKDKKPEKTPAEEPKKENIPEEKQPIEEPVEVNPPEEEEVEEMEESGDEKSNGAYFVSPHPDGGWQVKRAKAKKALKRFDTKAEAEKYAKQVAKNQESSVVRQKKDGKIQKKH